MSAGEGLRAVHPIDGPSRRKSAIEGALRARGYEMAHGLAVFDGDEGHPIVDLSTGEIVDPPDDEVLELATEWSLLEGAFIS